MRLRDAKPGERLVDPDGDIWQRCEDGSAVAVFVDEAIEWPEGDFDEADENFGPFLPAPPGYDDPMVLRAMRRVTQGLLPSVGTSR